MLKQVPCSKFTGPRVIAGVSNMRVLIVGLWGETEYNLVDSTDILGEHVAFFRWVGKGFGRSC
jgi:hypothetical protein